MPSFPVSPVIFSLILNELVVALSALKSAISPLGAKAGFCLQYCHKIPHVFE